MNKFIESITGILTVLAMLFFFIATPVGIFHAFKKHDALAGGLSLFVPPVAWYYALEKFFWYDEYANVDWDKRLKNDVLITFSMIGAESEIGPADIADFMMAREKFSKRMSDYPEDKRQLLSAAARSYMNYNQSYMSDWLQAFRNSDSNFKIQKSMNTLKYEDEIKNYPGGEDILRDINLAMDMIEEQLSSADFSSLTPEEKNKRLEILESQFKHRALKMEEAYSILFEQ